MIHEDYRQRIEEFERVLQKVATDMASGAVFERLPPMDLWKKTEAHVTRLGDLAKGCSEAMLILKPERAHLVEQRFKAIAQPLNVFKDILFQKTTDPLANSRLALEQLSRAIAGGSDFLILAKEIQEKPSPTISEILMLKRVAEAMEPASPLETPETPRLRPARLIWRIEALRASLTSLERALEEAKESLNSLREEILKYSYASAETSAKEKEESEIKDPQKRQNSLPR
ncbi:hypothetical protein GWO13_03895 [Candidatus Bathyarchaeota archaeon]|nr:hypothetical protein [Candidatus Bathyarchaeota archaeon]